MALRERSVVHSAPERSRLIRNASLIQDRLPARALWSARKSSAAGLRDRDKVFLGGLGLLGGLGVDIVPQMLPQARILPDPSGDESGSAAAGQGPPSAGTADEL